MNLKVTSILAVVALSSFALADDPVLPIVQQTQITVNKIDGNVQFLLKSSSAGKSAINHLKEAVEKYNSDVEAGITATQQDFVAIQSAFIIAAGALEDVINAGNQIDSDVNAVQTSLNGVATSVQANGTQLSAVVAQQNQMTATIERNRQEQLIFDVESQLKSGSFTEPLYRPSSQGGQLDFVRDLVSARVSQANSNGHDTSEAAKYLAKANLAFSKSDYNDALKKYSKCYGELVKADKSPWTMPSFPFLHF